MNDEYMYRRLKAARIYHETIIKEANETCPPDYRAIRMADSLIRSLVISFVTECPESFKFTCERLFELRVKERPE